LQFLPEVTFRDYINDNDTDSVPVDFVYTAGTQPSKQDSRELWTVELQLLNTNNLLFKIDTGLMFHVSV